MDFSPRCYLLRFHYSSVSVRTTKIVKATNVSIECIDLSFRFGFLRCMRLHMTPQTRQEIDR